MDRERGKKIRKKTHGDKIAFVTKNRITTSAFIVCL